MGVMLEIIGPGKEEVLCLRNSGSSNWGDSDMDPICFLG